MSKIICRILWHDWDYEVYRERLWYEDITTETFFRKCKRCLAREVVYKSYYSPSFVKRTQIIPVVYGGKEAQRDE